MVTIVICVGSSCYVRGSDQVAEKLEALIEKEGLKGQVELMGAFCMEQCSMGVSVRVGEQVYRGVRPEDAENLFYDQIMPQVRQMAA